MSVLTLNQPFKRMDKTEFLQIKQNRLKNTSINIAKSGYRLVLTPHFEQSANMTEEEHEMIDRLNEPIEFDLITEQSITATSEITQYPTITGGTIADHMIRQATTMTVGGVFSLHGNKPTSFVGVDDRLTNIQSFFEKIKDEGILCTLTTIDRASNSKYRFKTRESMALTSITWQENQSSMTFSFTFTEALRVDMIQPVPDYTDENVPAITDPSTLNFTDEFLDPEEITKIVVQQLQEVKLLDDDFALWVSQNVDTIRQIATITMIVAVVVGAKVLSTMITTAIAASVLGLATNPVGWIIGATAFAIGAIAAFFVWLCKSNAIKKAEEEYGIKAFRKSDSDEENEQTTERLCSYIGQVNQNLEALNNVIQVFALQANIEQECMLYVGSKYYIFAFTKNNTQTENKQTTWKLNIAFSDREDTKDIPDVCSAALDNIKDCTLDNMILKTDDGIWIYLINNKLYEVENATYNSQAERDKAIQDCKSDLTSYVILCSKTDMPAFCDKLKDVVIEAMKV